MSATGALNELADCEKALTQALENAVNLVGELGAGRRGRALALGAQIQDAIELVAKITMYARADAVAGNPHGFSEESR